MTRANQPGLTPAEQDDVSFFEANPNRRYRLRPASADEIADKLGVEVGKASAALGIWYAIVVKLLTHTPEILTKSRVFAVAEPLTFNFEDEENAHRIFLAVVRRQA